MIEAILQYQFLQNALLASLFASLVCGLIGVIVVEKKLVMMSGGIAHTAYGGVGLGYLCGFEPMAGAMLFAILAALGIGTVRRKGGAHTDVIVALLWSLGMALGIAFTGFMPGYPPDMSSYLFGNILSVTHTDLWIMAGMSFTVFLLITVLFNDWKAYLFDGEFAAIRGLRVDFLEYLLLILVALSVVVLIRVVGIILIIALLTAPAASAALLSKKMKTQMLLAVAFGIFFCFSGICASYYLNIASGSSIVIISVFVYACIYIYKRKANGGRKIDK